MKDTYEELAVDILKHLDNVNIRKGLSRSVDRLVPAPYHILDKWKYIQEYAEHVRKVKEEILANIDYYIDLTLKNVEKTQGNGYYTKTREDVIKIIDDIIGEDSKLIVKAKSMVTEEIGLREHLIEKGHKVYETDLGELLIQLSGDKPMHTTAPAIHITKEQAIKLLKNAGARVHEGMSIKEIVGEVRVFLRDKFINADIGISGANVVAADTGSIFLISNEGNIRNTTNLPPTHIAITGIEKIMPTMMDAFMQALVQAAYAGLYPPTYLSIISGPSSTADIEFTRVYGVHGPKHFHLILYDGGRRDAINHPFLFEQLYCIRCGRCQAECPIWDLVGNIWGGSVYGGPMGVGWTAITEGVEKATNLSHFCLNCGKCEVVCPVNIDMPRIIRYLKILDFTDIVP